MIKKLSTYVLLFAFILVGFGTFSVAHAQVASFPSGCTSTLGTSTTTGLPCNGTSSATTTFFAGCTSTLGFSSTNGMPCNGAVSATPAFFAGCTSTLGFSSTNGMPCNGGVSATPATDYFPGCSSTLGTSSITGLPCSGGMTPLPFLAGCTSTFDFSPVNGLPCNGTDVATLSGTSPAPGLPITGAGGNAPQNLVLLFSSGLISILGIGYLVRRRKAI